MSFDRKNSFTIHLPIWELVDSEIILQCKYSCDEEFEFTERFEFNFPAEVQVETKEQETLDALAKLVALASSTSYYKATRAKKVEVEFPITSNTHVWLKALLDEGLREFRFTNGFDLLEAIDFKISIEADCKTKIEREVESVLVPIGGGKDSALSLELATKTAKKVIGFSVGDFEPITHCAMVAGVDVLRVKREIDPKLFKLNEKGAPNGHIPVTAITSTLACFASVAAGLDGVAMSNEASANEETRLVDGITVNHQWSKSFEAETLLRDSLASLGVSTSYFSLLRNLSEFRIFQMFSELDHFHSVFTSCNRVFKIDEQTRSKNWCGDCDKCRFVFLGLSAFLGVDKASEVIGRNLFEDVGQLEGFRELVGIGKKPFECVGTINESRLLARNSLLFDAARKSVVGKTFVDEIVTISSLPEKNQKEITQNYVPEKFGEAINSLLSKQFDEHLRRHFDSDFVNVVGIGRDTAGIIKFLVKHAGISKARVYFVSTPGKPIPELQSQIKDFDLDFIDIDFEEVSSVSSFGNEIVFVSPGISKYSPEIVSLGENVTTPLAWWLEHMSIHYSDKIFIGITGTKGKSTTSSMLAHVLDDSIIAGNLGIGVGELEFVDFLKAMYVVLEVSSFQASYVQKSPDVVGFTALFDCHIDWHGTSENYHRDKINLALHGAQEIVASDSIENFGKRVLEYRQDLKETKKPDSITYVPSHGLSIKERNRIFVKEIVNLVAPELAEDEIEERLESFIDLEHRQEVIAKKNEVTFISDVLSTAPNSVIVGLDDIKLQYPNSNIVLLCGGAYQNVDLSDLYLGLNDRQSFVTVITLPETGHMIEEKLEAFIHADELADGVVLAFENTKPGDIVLLAPGAPSFHRYKNYVELAKHFKELVSKL